MFHNFLHNLQILQTNDWAHLASCSMAQSAPSARVKRSGFEADHSTLYSVKVENECSRYTSSVVLYLHYAREFNSIHRDIFSFISCLNYKDFNIQEITVCFCESFLAPYGKNIECVVWKQVAEEGTDTKEEERSRLQWNCVKRSFENCDLHQILVMWLNRGRKGGQTVWHTQADVKWVTIRSFTRKHPKKRDHQMRDLCTNRSNITADL